MVTGELTGRRSRQIELADCQHLEMRLLYFEHQRPIPCLRMKSPLRSASRMQLTIENEERCTGIRSSPKPNRLNRSDRIRRKNRFASLL